ncbi:MAG: hydroxymethylbilane synthase, partial [Planctomycetota bacterium]
LVAKALRKLHPVEVTFHWVKSEGDEVTQGSLADAGGKGLFTRRVDRAVLEGKADLAVHSLKDLPVDPAEAVAGMTLAATPKRTVVNDCLVSARRYASLADLPEAAVVGTASARRAAQARRLRPDLDIRLLRGNVDTRLNKVLSTDGPAYDAAILAVAGLKRLGLAEHADRVLSCDEMLPPACQGALGLTCRATDHVTLTRCLPLNAASTSTAVTHERQVVQLLGADCYSPIAVLAEPIDPAQTQAKRNADSHWYRLRVRLCSADGTRTLEADEKCKTGELRRVVKRVTARMLAEGARELLDDAAHARIAEPEGGTPERDSAEHDPAGSNGTGNGFVPPIQGANPGEIPGANPGATVVPDPLRGRVTAGERT